MNATMIEPTAAESCRAARPIKIRPTGDKILVRRTQADEVTPGGIYLPDQARQKPGRGTIVAVGPKVTRHDGVVGADRLAGTPVLAAGMEVYFSDYAGYKVQVPGEKDEFLLMKEEEVFATVEE